MGNNGNGGMIGRVIISLAIGGFCSLCLIGYFHLDDKISVNADDHVSIRKEAEVRVLDGNQILRDMMKENNEAHSNILQRLAHIEALLK